MNDLFQALILVIFCIAVQIFIERFKYPDQELNWNKVCGLGFLSAALTILITRIMIPL